jgi:phage shock protein A
MPRAETNSHRLDRIEEKIDKMADAIISLARAEEKIQTLSSFSKQQSTQILNLINRIEDLEKMVIKNQSSLFVINKFLWIVISAVVATIASMYLMNT